MYDSLPCEHCEAFKACPTREYAFNAEQVHQVRSRWSPDSQGAMHLARGLCTSYGSRIVNTPTRYERFHWWIFNAMAKVIGIGFAAICSLFSVLERVWGARLGSGLAITRGAPAIAEMRLPLALGYVPQKHRTRPVCTAFPRSKSLTARPDPNVVHLVALAARLLSLDEGDVAMRCEGGFRSFGCGGDTGANGIRIHIRRWR